MQQYVLRESLLHPSVVTKRREKTPSPRAIFPAPALVVDWGTSTNRFPVLLTTGTMIPRERPAVCATLALARTLSRFDAGFAVPAWRDARLVFDEATLDTLTPVELTVTRIMLTPCSDRSRHSLLARGSIRRPSKTPALTLPSDQMGYGGSLGRR